MIRNEMSSINLKPALKRKLNEVFNAPLPEIEHRAYDNLARAELVQVEVEIFKILNKHGIKSAVELDSWFKEGRITEADGWEDFFTLDGLEHKRKLLKEIIDELS
jgi:hypothetical protein